jgi:hypothetical protein
MKHTKLPPAPIEDFEDSVRLADEYQPPTFIHTEGFTIGNICLQIQTFCY